MIEMEIIMMTKFFEYVLVCAAGVVLFGGLGIIALLLGERQRYSVANWHAERARQAKNSTVGGMHNYTSNAIKEIEKNHRRSKRRAMVEDVKEWLMK